MALREKGYTVFGYGEVRSFQDLSEAELHARDIVRRSMVRSPVSVWDNERLLFIAVAIDDANGVTFHRLATWPSRNSVVNGEFQTQADCEQVLVIAGLPKIGNVPPRYRIDASAGGSIACEVRHYLTQDGDPIWLGVLVLD